jgi:hypothetical protein
MFHQLSRQGRQSIVMTIRRARIVTPFLRGEISRVAYTQQRGEDHFHLSAGRVHCRIAPLSKTIGIVWVAAFAASAAGRKLAAITAT